MQLRPYQIPIFRDNTTGVLILVERSEIPTPRESRQIGKSTVLSAWAIDRCLQGRTGPAGSGRPR